MPRAQLRQRIQELQEELERTDLDAEAREHLASLLQEIREAVDESRGEGEEDEDGSLLERLNEATRHFEESYPTLTTLVGRVAESLSNLGI